MEPKTTWVYIFIIQINNTYYTLRVKKGKSHYKKLIKAESTSLFHFHSVTLQTHKNTICLPLKGNLYNYYDHVR